MATYYVAPSGNDSNPGSERQPFRTIQRGVNATSAGDTVYVMDGTFVEEVDIGRSGTADRPITISAMPGHQPILDGKAGEGGVNNGLPVGDIGWVNPETGAGAKFTGLLDVNGSHIVIDGFLIRNSMGRGVRIFAHAGQRQENILFRNCHVHNSRESGILVQGILLGDGDVTTSRVRIEDSKVSWSSSYYPKRRAPSAGTDWHGSIAIKAVKGCAVRRCHIYENWSESILADANVGQSREITIEDNVFYDNFASCSLHAVRTVVFQRNFMYRSETDRQRQNPFGPSVGVVVTPAEQGSYGQIVTENITIVNNIIVGGYLGVALWGSAENAEVRNVLIANNTIALNSIGVNPATFNKRDIVFRNNIVAGRPGQTLVSDVGNRSASGWTYSNNLWTSRPSALLGTDDVVGDPLLENWLVEPPAGEGKPQDFRITEGSPAIGAGYALSQVINDYFGNRRDSAIDVGAHEYDASSGISVAFRIVDGNGTGQKPLTITFDASESSAVAGIARYEWDFGDGTTTTGTSPVQSHTYDDEGSYTVTLAVVDAKENRESLSKPDLVTVGPGDGTQGRRVTEGLQALYTFAEGSGGTILDVSEIGEPLDLQIENLAGITWLDAGISLNSPTLITSTGAATKLSEACKRSNEITLEAWLKPDNTMQKGPARIITISKDGLERNITLGQGLWGTKPADLYDVRLRTTERSENGTPSLFTTPGSLTDGRTHVVFTRDKEGRARVYINNKLAAQDTIAGDFSGWNARYPLLLGNETTNDRPWLGELYLVAIYARALTPAEVKQNFDAGIAVERRPPEPEIAPEFKRFLVVNGNGEVNGRSALEVEEHIVAIGIQFPDNRCVICGKGDQGVMSIFDNVDAVEHAMLNDETGIYWVD